MNKRRYSYGNPITRRGVAVSVENTMPSNIPVHVMKAEKIQSLNRWAQHSGLRYNPCSRSRNLNARKTLRESCDYSRYPALSSSLMHCTDGCIYEQNLRSQNNHSNKDAPIEMTQNGRRRLLRQYTPNKNIAITSATKSLSSIYDKNIDVQSISETPGKLHQQKSTSIRIDQKLLHTELSPNHGRIKIGIHRFQKREKYPSELIYNIGGSGIDPCDNKNIHMWGDMKSNEMYRSLDVIPTFRNKSTYRRDAENDSFCEQSSRQKMALESHSNMAIPDTISRQCFYDTVHESTKMKGLYPRSHLADKIMEHENFS